MQKHYVGVAKCIIISSTPFFYAFDSDLSNNAITGISALAFSQLENITHL